MDEYLPLLKSIGAAARMRVGRPLCHVRHVPSPSPTTKYHYSKPPASRGRHRPAPWRCAGRSRRGLNSMHGFESNACAALRPAGHNLFRRLSPANRIFNNLVFRKTRGSGGDSTAMRPTAAAIASPSNSTWRREWTHSGRVSHKNAVRRCTLVMNNMISWSSLLVEYVKMSPPRVVTANGRKYLRQGDASSPSRGTRARARSTALP